MCQLDRFKPNWIDWIELKSCKFFPYKFSKKICVIIFLAVSVLTRVGNLARATRVKKN